VKLEEEEHRATVTVTEDQQSLAIGRGGQNVRLAAKLTGWNIDIISLGGNGENVADSEVNSTETTTNPAPDMTPEQTNPEEVEATDEQIDEGAVEMAQAMADTKSDDDMPETEGVDGITEQNSVVTEDDQPSNELVAEEETNMTDNGPISDAQESRDEG
jgi:N utilization substance protein A